jgi:hypothetical protein
MSKNRKAKRRTKSRAMPLAIAEPRLRAPRAKPLTKSAQVVQLTQKRSVRSAPEHAEQETFSAWLPWNIAIRQQAIAASAFFNLLQMQHQIAQSWLSPARSADRR